jgi:hypothetical protein
MKVGRTTRLKSAPGRSWEMMCDSTDMFESVLRCGDGIVRTISLVGLDDLVFPAKRGIIHR